ncbi:MAG: Ig-like domain-containing protein [Candidatus Zixiibacteriota bacterium]
MKKISAQVSYIGWVVLIISGLMLLSFLASCGKKKVTGEDTTPPTVEILLPTNNSEVSDTVEISVKAEDNLKVAKVEFYIDSQLFFTDTQSPWKYDWTTYLYDDSTSHMMYVVAYDQANNSATSSVITVTVRVSAGFYFISDFYTPGMAYDVFVQGNYAYVADGEEGLRIINVRNPANPYLEGSFNTSGFTKGVFVTGNHAYLADGSEGLQIVDISNSSSPDSAGSFKTQGYAEDVFVSGNYAYVADGAGGLQIIDVTDPNNPDPVAHFFLSSPVMGVFVKANYAYLAITDGLQILDVSDPSNPSVVGSYYALFGGYKILVEGYYAYLVTLGGGLHIFDVFDPGNPIVLNTSYNPGGGANAYGVSVKGDLVYIALGDEGVHVIDVSDPYQISFVGRFDTEGKSYDLFVVDKLIYVADNTSLVILRLSRS